MLVRNLLHQTLDGLLKDEFKEFKWLLASHVLENCDPIPRSHLEDASRIDVVDKLLQRYGEETAARITTEALKMMNMNKAAEDVRRMYAEGRSLASPSTAPPSTAPSSSQRPSAEAPRTVMTAEGGSKIIAPTITVGDTTTCNITISH